MDGDEAFSAAGVIATVISSVASAASSAYAIYSATQGGPKPPTLPQAVKPEDLAAQQAAAEDVRLRRGRGSTLLTGGGGGLGGGMGGGQPLKTVLGT